MAMENFDIILAGDPFRDAGNAESEKESESSLALESMSDWSDKIPVEVLRMIFDELVSIPCQRGTYEWKQIRKSLVNCRSVHPRWKSVMDSLLESKICATHWKRLGISYDEASIEFAYDDLWSLQVISTKQLFKMEWVLCPPSIYNGGSSSVEANPFPTKSLTVSYNRATKEVDNFQPMRGVKFFSQFGYHLTSLTFSTVPIDPEDLVKILEHTPHLKTLTFCMVEIMLHLPGILCQCSQEDADVCGSSPLPPLPHLEHLDIFGCDVICFDSSYVEVQDIDPSIYLVGWIVKPYIEQLLTLKTDGAVDVFREPIPFSFEKLTHLSIWDINDLKMLTIANYPQIRYLCLGEVSDIRWRMISLERVQGCLAHFASTLVELHLVIFTSEAQGEIEDTRLLQYSGNQEEKEYGWSKTQTVFSELKKFSIYYPCGLEERETLKDILKYMPNLETLNLLRFRSSFQEDDEFSEEDKEAAREHTEQERYWTICPKLKKITVRMELKNESIFFTGRVANGIISAT